MTSDQPTRPTRRTRRTRRTRPRTSATASPSAATTTSKAAAVAFGGVVKSYSGAVRAIDDLDLTIRRGETVALLGPNGAGKSTAIGMLLGLTRPDAGTIRVFGGDPATAVRAGRIGAMTQEGRLIPRVRVRELIEFVGRCHRNAAASSRTPAEEPLSTAWIGDLADRWADGLSGGQTQRVRFAIAVAGRPDLVVLDEPTAALDVESRRELWAGIRSFADHGRTVLFSTHHLEEADDNADRIVVLARGRVIADGTGAEIKRRVGGRTVQVDADRTDGSDLTGLTALLTALPGVISAEVTGGRARLYTADSDATVVALARAGLVRNLEVTGVGLEQAFLALTTTDPATGQETMR